MGSKRHCTLRSVLDPKSLNIFTDEEVDDKRCNISKFVGGSKLERAIDIVNISHLDVHL